MIIDNLKESLTTIHNSIKDNLNTKTESIHTYKLQSYLDMINNYPMNRNLSYREMIFNLSRSINNSIVEIPFNDKIYIYTTLYNDINNLKELVSNNSKEIRNRFKYGYNYKNYHICNNISNLEVNNETDVSISIKDSNNFKSLIGNSDNIYRYFNKVGLTNYVYNLEDSNGRYSLNSIVNNFASSDLEDIPNNVDYTNYNIIQVPSSKFNYYIQIKPNLVVYGPRKNLVSQTTFTLPEDGNYDIMIYPDRLIYISGGSMNTRVDYKVFRLPSLEVITSGSNIKEKVYSEVLNLNRFKIIGPNAYHTLINLENMDDINSCDIRNGFRIVNGYIQDIFLDSIRKETNNPIAYDKYISDSKWVHKYY